LPPVTGFAGETISAGVVLAGVLGFVGGPKRMQISTRGMRLWTSPAQSVRAAPRHAQYLVVYLGV
jgi:hypothetical protein